MDRKSAYVIYVFFVYLYLFIYSFFWIAAVYPASPDDKSQTLITFNVVLKQLILFWRWVKFYNI